MLIIFFLCIKKWFRQGSKIKTVPGQAGSKKAVPGQARSKKRRVGSGRV
jgi:hypothetical protein